MVIHQPFIYFGDYWLDINRSVVWSVISFPLFLKTGITSAGYKQWGNSPLTRDWLKFWNVNLDKIDVFIHFNKFYRYVTVRTSFFRIKSFNYIFHFVYWNKLETDRENIFDFIMSLIFVTLGWFWSLNDPFFTGPSMFSVFRM